MKEEKFYSIHQGCKFEGRSTTHNYKSLDKAIEKAKELMAASQKDVDDLWGKRQGNGGTDMYTKLTWRVVFAENEHIKFNAENDHDEIIVMERTFDD